MSELAKLQAEFESAKPGYAFGKLPSGNYIYEGVNDMFKDYLENNELRKAKLRITELEAQLSAAKKDAAWLPIETTPKDGTEIVVGYGRQSGFPKKIVFFNKLHNFWSHYGEADIGLPNNATHWMPLPKSPLAGEATK